MSKLDKAQESDSFANQPRNRMSPKQLPIIATDLDGTLIPLDEEPDNKDDLEKLRELHRRRKFSLVFVTGRHLESVLNVMDEVKLPIPDWIICDVGTTICRSADGGEFPPIVEYQDHLMTLVESLPREELREHLHDAAGLTEQEAEKQGPYKLSYYTDAGAIDTTAEVIRRKLDELEAPYNLIASVDPFNGDGLLDLLPKNASKAYALQWWAKFQNLHMDHIVFAGDSGNDRAVFESGCRSIIVANADRELAAQVEQTHERKGWSDRLFLANRTATSGVLEGGMAFGVFPNE